MSFSSATAWAERDFPQRVEVDGPRGSQDGSSAAPLHISTNPVTTVRPNQSQDNSTNEQARLYQRANENLITQTVYIEKNLDSVKAISDKLGQTPQPASTPTTDDIANIPILTSQYCNDSVTQDATDNYTPALRCLEQYREMKIAQLRELRQGLVHNDDAQAKLRNDLAVKGKAGGATSSRAPVFGANIKSRVFPEIPKYVDMQKDYATRPKIIQNDKQLKRSQAVEIAKRMLTKPKPEDFVKVSEDLIDPSNPKAGTFHKILTDSNGKPVLDGEAFKAAQKIYDQMIKAQGGSNSADPNAEAKKINEIATRIMDAQEKQEALAAKTGSNMDAGVGSDLTKKGPQACDDLPVGPRQDYCKARDVVVMFFNGEAPTQQAAQNKNVLTKGANRAPGAATMSKGAHTEEYELKASKPSPTGKDETENLYMDPSYIDDVIKDQYPSP